MNQAYQYLKDYQILNQKNMLQSDIEYMIEEYLLIKCGIV